MKLQLRICIFYQLLILGILLFPFHSSAQIINTFAGSNSKGDGGPATEATVAQPSSVATDKNGNLYIADTDNHRIRKVSMNGTITTVAGNGTAGFSGDGGDATNAQLKSPYGIIFDDSGNYFIVDNGNNRIRKVSSSGIITTVAGNGYGGDGGAAINASLTTPTGIAVDKSGNLFIAEQSGHRIRKISTSGLISTVAGNGTPGFGGDGGAATNARLNSPYGVMVDDSNNLFVADRSNNRVRKISSTGIISTVAGTGGNGFSGDGGLATNAQIAFPTEIIVGNDGNLIIVDNGNQRIRKISSSGIISTIAGNGYGGDGGPAMSARLYYPTGISMDGSGNLFIAESSSSRIRKVSTSGIISTVAGNGTTSSASGDGGPAPLANLTYPTGVTIDKNGNFFISDTNNHRIRKVSSNGIISTVAGNGTFSFNGDGGLAINASLNSPYGVAVDKNGNLFIADHYNSRIRRVSSTGIITTIAGNGTFGFGGDGGLATNASLNYPTGVAVDESGNLFIADRNNNRIRKVSFEGIITTVAGTGGNGFSGDGGVAANAQLSGPTGVVVDENGNLLIADSNNNRIRKISSTGMIITVAGKGTGSFSGDGMLATNAQLNYPTGVAVDKNGTIFIADNDNKRIRKVSLSGVISTVAGNGMPNFNGDGGIAINASISSPYGVAVDEKGNIFIADSNNNRIRKVSRSEITSVQNGDWLNTATWNCSCVPSNNDRVIISIGHSITLSQAVQIQALSLYGTIVLSSDGKISF